MDLRMSKDMRDSPRANLGFAANMFDATNYPHIPCTSTWLNHVKSPYLIANPTDKLPFFTLELNPEPRV